MLSLSQFNPKKDVPARCTFPVKRQRKAWPGLEIGIQIVYLMLAEVTEPAIKMNNLEVWKQGEVLGNWAPSR